MLFFHTYTLVTTFFEHTRLQTALHKAAWFGYRDICEILIEKGASLTRTDYQYNTPYDKAVQNGDVELQKFLNRKLL